MGACIGSYCATDVFRFSDLPRFTGSALPDGIIHRDATFSIVRDKGQA